MDEELDEIRFWIQGTIEVSRNELLKYKDDEDYIYQWAKRNLHVSSMSGKNLFYFVDEVEELY